MRDQDSACVETYGVHVCMSGLCSWFTITVSRNSCSACVNRPAGASLARCTHGGCMPVAVRLSVHRSTGV